MILARKLLGMLALLCCSISLAVPSSARSLHLVDHVSAPGVVGDFHSHDESSDPSEAGAEDQDSSSLPGEEGTKNSGHTHMPSSVSDLSQAAEPHVKPRHLVGDDSHVAANLPSLASRGWSPPVRPPRAA